MKNVCTEASAADFSELIGRVERSDEEAALFLANPKAYLRSHGLRVPRNTVITATPSKDLIARLTTEPGRRDFITSTTSPGAELKVHIKTGIGKCTTLTVK